MSWPARILHGVLALAVAGASLKLGGRLGGAAEGRVLEALVVPGLFCIFGSKAMAWAAAAGLRWTSPVEVAPAVFVVLGWALLLASFLPVVLASRVAG